MYTYIYIYIMCIYIYIYLCVVFSLVWFKGNLSLPETYLCVLFPWGLH